MEEIKELIKLAFSERFKTKHTLKYITGPTKSLSNKLISDIFLEKINSDDEAQKVLYGKKTQPIAYKKLKERIKQRLFTNILFVQSSLRNEKTYSYNVFFCHKHYIIASLLIKIGSAKVGVRLMRRVMVRAQKFQVIPIVLLAASILRKLSVERADAKSFNIYSGIIKSYQDLIKAENDADEKHDRIMMHFAHSYSPRPDLIPEVAEAVEDIRALKDVFNTFNLNLLYFLVRNLHAQLTDNYKESLAICTEFEEYFISQPIFYTKSRHANIIIIKVDSYLCLGEYGKGIELAQRTLPLYETMIGNRLILLELQLVMALRTSSYVQAAEIYTLLIAFLESTNVHAHQKEMWQILGGYLWLCLTVEKMITLREDVFANTSNSLTYDILSAMPIYKKDKRGINLSRGFLQYMLYINQNDFHKAIDKTEQLKTYMYKYISRKFGAREYIFLKLLLLLQKENFNPAVVEKKAVVLLSKLKGLPVIAFAYANIRVEVLTYDQLWEILLKSIKNPTI